MLELLNIPRSMLPEVRNSSEVYGQTNIGVKAAYVFLLRVLRVTNKRHFTAIYAHAQAKRKTPMVLAALCCYTPVIKLLPLKMVY